MNTKPFFSIIMPLYNHEDYVAEAIQSALSQEFENFELIICNDGSTDNSEEIVLSFNDQRINYFRKPNAGAASALNSSLLESRGKYICWLSSDDIYHKKKLKKHYEFHSNSEQVISIAPYGHIYQGKKESVLQKIPEHDHVLLDFLVSTYINGLSICVNRDAYRDFGLFNSRYQYACDAERWFCFFKTIRPTFIDGDALSFSRKNTSSINKAYIRGYLDTLRFLLRELNLNGFSGFLLKETVISQKLFKSITNILCSNKNIFARFNCLDVLWAYFLDFLKNENQYNFYVEFLSKLDLNVEKISKDNLDLFKDFLFYNKDKTLVNINSFEILIHAMKTKNAFSGDIDIISNYLLIDY